MKLKITLLSLVTTILFTQCTVQNPSNDLSKVVVLKNTSGWKIDTIDQGLVHYEFPSQYMDEFKSYQNVNVMAIHPQLAKQYLIDFTDITPRDTLSAIGHSLQLTGRIMKRKQIVDDQHLISKRMIN